MKVELKVTPDKYLPHRYAGASGDFNPIHIDVDFAKQVGLPSNILHGLYTMAQVARANVNAAGGDDRQGQGGAGRPHDRGDPGGAGRQAHYSQRRGRARAVATIGAWQ
jgi:acyl dehydratase